MRVDELAKQCVTVINGGGTFMTLIKPAKMPKGFPRGEFMGDAGRGKVYSYNAERVLAWMVANGLVVLADPQPQEKSK